MSRILVVGGGVFGLPAALSLRERGHQVTLLDSGTLPNPLAAATDVSKVVRADYMDPVYVDLAIEALAAWDQWNRQSPRPFFHRTGVWILSSHAPGPDRFESVARQLLEERGQPSRLVTPELLADEFPALNQDAFSHGYHSPTGGWAESGNVMGWLAQRARAAGVEIIEEVRISEILRDNHRVTGARSQDGREFAADHTLVAAGAWTPTLLPELAPHLMVTGQPILFFRPRSPEHFQSPRFSVWMADLETSGWYGFPVLADGRLKIARHVPGTVLGPDDERQVSEEDIQTGRAFAARIFPALEGHPVVETRRCLYCSTPSEGFLIDRHPELGGLTVATGGTGHAFKFAPVMGDIVADTVEGTAHRYGNTFSWHTALGGSSL